MKAIVAKSLLAENRQAPTLIGRLFNDQSGLKVPTATPGQGLMVSGKRTLPLLTFPDASPLKFINRSIWLRFQSHWVVGVHEVGFDKWV